MTLIVIGLNDLLSELAENDVQNLLNTFETHPNYRTGDQNDVEEFLHKKAIQFQRMSLASTYIIFSSYRGNQIIVGFFSVTNKPLVISHKVFAGLSKSLQKRLNNLGTRYPDGDGKINKSDLVIPAYLLGQIGKNYSQDAQSTKAISGINIVAMAEEKLKEAIDIINGKYVWLECQDEQKLISFYSRLGYSLVENHESTNGLRLMIKKLV